MEGSLSPARRESPEDFISSGYGTVCSANYDGNVHVDSLHRQAVSMTPRLPGCSICGGDHLSPGCILQPVPCSYPRCTSDTPHFIFTCPSLHQRCEVCFARGHSREQDVCRDLENNFLVFETYADKGLATSLRRADPAWGQWSLQGPVSAAQVRAAGYPNLVRQGPVTVGRWLRLTTRATQAFLRLDVPPRRGLAQENVTLAPLDGDSREGWSTVCHHPSTSAHRPRPGASRRPETAKPSRGRGGPKPHTASSQAPGWASIFLPAHHQAPECGNMQPRYATSTPSGGGRSSRPGNVHASDRASDSSTSHRKRRPSPRSSDRAARRRIRRRESSSPSTSTTPQGLHHLLCARWVGCLGMRD